MAMFGLDADARDKVANTIKDVVTTFSTNYAQYFRVAFCNSILESTLNKEDDEKVEWELAQAPEPSPPDHKGFMKKQSSILKSWKSKFFAVNDTYELTFSAGPDKKEEGVINLWGYKCQLVNEMPKGKRRGGPEWVEDDARMNCKACDKSFTVTNRRHHCRNCGEIFCGGCTENRLPLFHFGYEKPERVCAPCFEAANVTRNRQDTFVPQQPEEKQDQTFFGISLIHRTRTPISLSCESKDEREKWLDVINICISNSQVPTNPDPVLAEAFEGAYVDTCWHFGYWRWWRVTGSEEEMLGELVAHVLQHRVINDILLGDKIPAKFRKNVEEAIQKQVKLLVTAAVGPAWKAIVDGISNTKSAIEEKVKPMLEPVGAAKASLIQKVTEAVMDKIKPILDKVGGPVMEQLLKHVMQPLLDAHTSLYSVIARMVQEIRDSVKNDSDKVDAFKEQIKRFYPRIRGDYYYYYPVWKNLDALWDSLNDLKKKADGNLDSINVSATVHTFNKGLHDLARNALYTLETDEQLLGELETQADAAAAIANAFKRMAPKLQADSSKVLKDSFIEVLKGALLPPVSKAVMENEAVSATLEPIDDLVPEAVKDYLSASSCLEDLLENLATEVVTSTVEAGQAQSVAQLTQEIDKAINTVSH